MLIPLRLPSFRPVRLRMGALAGFALLTAAVPSQAQLNGPLSAQSGPSRNQQILRAVAGFFDLGGYFYSSSSAHDALGSPKFYFDTQLFVRPKYYGRVSLTGGLEYTAALDHFLPFSNAGNDFTLIGPAFRVSTYRVLGHPRPYLTGGLFAGTVRSDRQNFSRTDFTPSMEVGVEYPFARYFTVVGSYRISEHIHGVNTDGFSLSLRFF